MALIQCGECKHDVSDKAVACPHCGAPVRAVAVAAPAPAQQFPPTPRTSGCAPVLLVAAGLVVLLLVLSRITSSDSDSPASPPPPAAPSADDAANDAIRATATAKFAAMSVVRDASWVRPGEFWISVDENGQPWQAVADSACAWIRQQGMRGAFSVSVMEASAIRNKRVEQLAYASCQ